MQPCLTRCVLRPLSLRPAQTLSCPLSNCLRPRGSSRVGASPLPAPQFHFMYVSSIALRARLRSSGVSTELSRLLSAEEGEVWEGGREGGRGASWRRGRKEKRVDLWKIKQKRYTQHITNLVRKGKVEEAEDVFRDMLSANVRPSTVTFNNLIAGLSRHGNAEHAFKYFNNLKKRGLLPTDHTYASLFRACAMMGPSSRELLEKVVFEINCRGHLLNTIATNSLIAAMTTCGMTDEAFQAYFDLCKHRHVPDVSTFTGLLNTCAWDRERGMEKVTHVLQEMSACRVEPDIIFFNTLLQCVREAGASDDSRQHDEVEVVIPAVSMQELFSVLDSSATASNSYHTREMDDKPPQHSRLRSAPFRVVSKDQLHFSVIGTQLTVHVASSGWRWMDSETVSAFLGMLKDCDLKPNIQTLSLLSQMAVDWTGLVREVGMSTEGVLVDRKCLDAAVRLQAKLGNTNTAKVLRVFGEESGLCLGLAGYQSLAKSCNRRQQGLELLSQMKESGAVPDQHTMETLLGNAASGHDYEYLTELMKVMRHCKMTPNGTMALILKKVADGNIPQSPRMKLRFNGFKGYYTLWKRHYPELET